VAGLIDRLKGLWQSIFGGEQKDPEPRTEPPDPVERYEAELEKQCGEGEPAPPPKPLRRTYLESHPEAVHERIEQRHLNEQMRRERNRERLRERTAEKAPEPPPGTAGPDPWAAWTAQESQPGPQTPQEPPESPPMRDESKPVSLPTPPIQPTQAIPMPRPEVPERLASTPPESPEPPQLPDTTEPAVAPILVRGTPSPPTPPPESPARPAQLTPVPRPEVPARPVSPPPNDLFTTSSLPPWLKSPPPEPTSPPEPPAASTQPASAVSQTQPQEGPSVPETATPVSAPGPAGPPAEILSPREAARRLLRAKSESLKAPVRQSSFGAGEGSPVTAGREPESQSGRDDGALQREVMQTLSEIRSELSEQSRAIEQVKATVLQTLTLIRTLQRAIEKAGTVTQ